MDESPSTACHLLTRLPAELREQIYKLALPTGRTRLVIARFPKTLAQPPLLCTCHYIRNEASQLYYRSKSFRIFMHHLDFDADFLLAFFAQSGGDWWVNDKDKDGIKRSFATSPRQHLLNLRLSGSKLASWQGLLVWLKAFREDRAPRPLMAEDSWGEQILKAFDIVSESGALEWGKVTEMLELHRGESRKAETVFWV